MVPHPGAPGVLPSAPMEPQIEPPPPVRTKVIATLGPATETTEAIAALMAAGADAFRLNMAHGTREWHARSIRRVREASRAAGRPVAILADLGGPKIRLGPVPDGTITLQPDDTVRLVAVPPSATAPRTFTLSWTPLLEQLRPGHRVLLGDGAVQLVVEQASAS